jgi:hypothetical protein
MWTLPDIVETICLIDDQDEADDFMEAYAAVCVDDDHALHNVGYIADLLMSDDEDEESQEFGKRILELFDVERQITPVQVFKNSSLGVKSDREKVEPVAA